MIKLEQAAQARRTADALYDATEAKKHHEAARTAAAQARVRYHDLLRNGVVAAAARKAMLLAAAEPNRHAYLDVHAVGDVSSMPAAAAPVSPAAAQATSRISPFAAAAAQAFSAEGEGAVDRFNALQPEQEHCFGILAAYASPTKKQCRHGASGQGGPTRSRSSNQGGEDSLLGMYKELAAGNFDSYNAAAEEEEAAAAAEGDCDYSGLMKDTVRHCGYVLLQRTSCCQQFNMQAWSMLCTPALLLQPSYDTQAHCPKVTL